MLSSCCAQAPRRRYRYHHAGDIGAWIALQTPKPPGPISAVDRQPFRRAADIGTVCSLIPSSSLVARVAAATYASQPYRLAKRCVHVRIAILLRLWYPRHTPATFALVSGLAAAAGACSPRICFGPPWAISGRQALHVILGAWAASPVRLRRFILALRRSSARVTSPPHRMHGIRAHSPDLIFSRPACSRKKSASG